MCRYFTLTPALSLRERGLLVGIHTNHPHPSLPQSRGKGLLLTFPIEGEGILSDGVRRCRFGAVYLDSVAVGFGDVGVAFGVQLYGHGRPE